jgi:hypothetical protein
MMSRNHSYRVKILCCILLSSLAYGFIPSSQTPQATSIRRSSVFPRISVATISSTGHELKSYRVMKLAASTTDELETIEATLSPRRISYLTLWAGLLAYATYFTSSLPKTPEAEALSAQILNTAIFTPFDGSLSPVFVTLFFFLGKLSFFSLSLSLSCN